MMGSAIIQKVPCRRHQNANASIAAIALSSGASRLARGPIAAIVDGDTIIFDRRRLLDWATKKGKKVAPGLALVRDPQTPRIVLNTLYLVVGTTVIDTLVGLGLAVLMEGSFRGLRFIRTLYLLPIMTAPIVVALCWRAMFNNDAGWINYALKLLGLPQPVWLGNPALAMPAVIISDMWTGVPFQAVLLLAGLLGVSAELKEAAQADGANGWQVFWHVTLPSVRPVLMIAVILKFIDAFRKFEGIQLLTTGGPGIASTTLNLHIFVTGLTYDRVGYAATFGVVMIAMIAATVGVLYAGIRRLA